MEEPKIEARLRLGDNPRLQIGDDRLFAVKVPESWKDAPHKLIKLQFVVAGAGEEEESESVEFAVEDLNTKAKDELADQILLTGIAKKTVYLGNRRMPVVFSVYPTRASLDLNTLVKGDVIPAEALQSWGQDYTTIRTLARCIESYDGKVLNPEPDPSGKIKPMSRKAREDFIMGKPFPVRDYLWMLWLQFLREIAACLVPDYLEERMGNS